MRVRVAPIRVQGEKVVLREKRLSDSQNDYAWSTDEELSRLDAANPLRLTFQQTLMLYEEELAYPNPRRQRFAVDTLDGVHIGNCMVYDINESQREAELGIMIGNRRYWGKSYGTDAVKTLLRYAFTQTRLERIYLHTLDWNVRAQKSFEKAGFSTVTKIHRSGFDFIAMEVYKDEWEGKSQASDSASPRTGWPRHPSQHHAPRPE